MNLTVSGHQIPVTAMMYEVATMKLKELEKRIEAFKSATTVRVVYSGKRKNGWAQAIKLIVRVPGKGEIELSQFLCRSMGDFYDAVRAALGRLAEKFSRINDKRKAHRHMVKRVTV